MLSKAIAKPNYPHKFTSQGKTIQKLYSYYGHFLCNRYHQQYYFIKDGIAPIFAKF